MPRQPRIDIGDTVYHVINRANARAEIFVSDSDYLLFEKELEEAKEIVGMRILGYCIMPNHWHLILYPRNDGDLSEFMKRLTNAHTRLWHAFHDTIGHGHLYQGRYKSFMIQNDAYLLQAIRYVEQNPLRAKLVKRAQAWKWSSLRRREYGNEKEKKFLSNWPIDVPDSYLKWVNKIDENVLDQIRNSVNKGKPFGNDAWVLNMVERFKLQNTTRNPGRPKG